MSEPDPFATLGCSPRFAIAEEEIRQRQRAALAQLHPDRFADAIQRADAMRTSAAISAAARALLDPMARAEAMLRLTGAATTVPAPPALLMSSLEWREQVEEARAAGDSAALAEILRPIEARMDEVLKELTTAIDGARADARTTVRIDDPTRAAALHTELRILRRILESPQEQRL